MNNEMPTVAFRLYSKDTLGNEKFYFHYIDTSDICFAD